MRTIIVADYVICGKLTDCMVSAYGTPEILDRMINNPTEEDKRYIKDGKNLRLEEVEEEKCWWNFYGTD